MLLRERQGARRRVADVTGLSVQAFEVPRATLRTGAGLRRLTRPLITIGQNAVARCYLGNRQFGQTVSLGDTRA